MKLDELRLLKEEIIEKYYEGLPITEIGKLFTSRKTSIKTILEENGIEINRYGAINNRALNHDYFKKIDSAEKAYFVGFIFADGSVYWRERKTTTNAILQIDLAEVDEEIIIKFLKELNANYKLHHSRGSVSVKITSNSLVEDLKRHEVVPNKTYESHRLSRNIPEEFEIDFLRGLIDGDGSIYLDDRGNKRLSFISYSKDITKEVQERIDNLIGKEAHTKINEQKNGFTATWSGKLQVQKILSILYYENCLALERKFQKAVSKI